MFSSIVIKNVLTRYLNTVSGFLIFILLTYWLYKLDKTAISMEFLGNSDKEDKDLSIEYSFNLCLNLL